MTSSWTQSFCLSVRIQIHGLSGYLLLQFWSYSFNILHDVYTHYGGVHVHRILIFITYLIMTGSWTSFPSYQLHNGNMVCPANSSYSFRATDYSFNILQDVYTHNLGVHVHRILIFIKYSQNDKQLDLVIFAITWCPSYIVSFHI